MAEKKKFLKVTGSLSGLFNFSFYRGQIVKIGSDIDEKQAEEIVSVRLGEYVDSAKEEAAKVPKETEAQKKEREKAVKEAQLKVDFDSLKEKASAAGVAFNDATTFEDLTAAVVAAEQASN